MLFFSWILFSCTPLSVADKSPCCLQVQDEHIQPACQHEFFTLPTATCKYVANMVIIPQEKIMSCEPPCSYRLDSIYSTFWKAITKFIPGIHSGENTCMIIIQIVKFEINHCFYVLWSINSSVIFRPWKYMIYKLVQASPARLFKQCLETNAFGRFRRFPVCCLLPLRLASTRARTRRGNVAEMNYAISAHYPRQTREKCSINRFPRQYHDCLRTVLGMS